MATIYSQNWGAGQGNHAMTNGFYKSNAWVGGTGTPDAVYPELRETEGIKVVIGTGPAGENVLDLDASAGEDYVSMNATFDAFGSVSTAHSSGWWNATEGTFSVDFFPSTTAWDERFFEYIFGGIGLPTFPESILLYIDDDGNANPPSGGILTLQGQTFSGGISGIHLATYTATRASSIGGIALENAWNTITIAWKCGTVTGAFASVAHDGFLTVTWNGVTVYDVQNTDLVINAGADLNPNTTSAGTDAAAIQNLARAFVLGNAGIFGPTTNILLTDTATAPPAPPDPPTAFRILAGDDMVVLGWSASNGAPLYNVKRSTSSGTEVTIASVAAGEFADTTPPGFVSYGFYADATAVNGVTYFYTVTGVNDSGEGDPATEQSATPSAPASPLYGPDAFVGMDQLLQTLFRETYWIEFQTTGIPTSGGNLGPSGELVLMSPYASPSALTTGSNLAQAVWGKVFIPEGPYGSVTFDGWLRTASDHSPANDFRSFVFGIPPIVNPSDVTWAYDAGALVPGRSVFGFQLASDNPRSLQFLFVDRNGTTIIDQTATDVLPNDLPGGAWHSYRMEWRLSVPEGTPNGGIAFYVDNVRVYQLNCIDLYTILGSSRWNAVNGSQVGGVTNLTYFASTADLPACGSLRLTQLPVEVASDYSQLQRSVKGGGLNWITPPPTI